LGEFDGEDRILTVMPNGTYELTSFDLNNHFDDKMAVIEKYEPEKVYTVVHYDGKSKNYMVKRFVFENIAIGKEMSIISDESGSKMILISGAAQSVVKVEQLKGKTAISETVELNLADLIDIKGMKAMGNKLSAHVVQKIELLAEHDDAEDVPDPAPDTLEDVEITVTPEDKVAQDVPPVKEAVKKEIAIAPAVEMEEEETAAEKEEAIADAPVEKTVEDKLSEPKQPAPAKPKAEPAAAKAEPEPPAEKPVKKIDLEITNPDDIDIDDKGQTRLF
ncbi:MAG: DNA gyrase/topoisomerase IV subunit A, partial [Chitinophagaceae bacterium]